MVRVVVVLLQQYDDQLKIGLSWMEVYILSLVTDWWISNTSVGGMVPSYKLRGPEYGMLIISMAECEGLALVTLARIEIWPS
jgi:hypothetical protein